MTAPLITGPIFDENMMLKFSFVYPAKNQQDGLVVFEWSCGLGYLPQKVWHSGDETLKRSLRSRLSLPTILQEQMPTPHTSTNVWSYWVGRFSTLRSVYKLQFLEAMMKMRVLRPTEDDLLESLFDDTRYLAGIGVEEALSDPVMYGKLKEQQRKIIKVFGQEWIDNALTNNHE
jgi:hypothetical protein